MRPQMLEILPTKLVLKNHAPMVISAVNLVSMEGTQNISVSKLVKIPRRSGTREAES